MKKLALLIDYWPELTEDEKQEILTNVKIMRRKRLGYRLSKAVQRTIVTIRNLLAYTQ